MTVAVPFVVLAAVAALGAPPDVEVAWLSADAAVRAGDYRAAAGRCRDLLADLETRPAAQAPAEAWTGTLLRLAVAEGTLGNVAASRDAMERALAPDPSLALDPDLYSPAFRKEFDAARARVAARPRLTLRVESRGGGGRGWVQGRSLGALPAEVFLPPGRYRVGVEEGGAERTITVDLVLSETVVVDAAAPRPDLSASPPAPGGPVAPSGSDGAWMAPVAWTATGLAVVATGLAIWQGVAAAGSWSEATGMLQPDGTLKPGVDPAAYAAARSAYDSETTLAWVAGGCAVGLAAGATVLFVLAPSAPVKPAPGGLALRF